MVATMVATFQLGTGEDLKITTIPDYDMSKEKVEFARFGVEMREQLIAPAVWQRISCAIQATEDAETERGHAKYGSKVNGQTKGK